MGAHIGIFWISLVLVACQTPSGLEKKRDHKELLLAGYQGWFSTPKLSKWNHWSNEKEPSPKNITFELYPDVREYPRDALTEAKRLSPLGNGTPSLLYDSSHPGVVDTHFRWMNQYGIDGIVLQRFIETSDSQWKNNHFSKLLKNIFNSATKYQRYFYLMYDVVGKNKTKFDVLKNDWEGFVDKDFSITNHPFYVHANGKPVIGLWGFGFSFSKTRLDDALKTLRWLKSKGFYVVGGVPYFWRTGRGAGPYKKWQQYYAELDEMIPWAVAAIVNEQQVKVHYEKIWKDDFKEAHRIGTRYGRVLYPGFSWSNWKAHKPNVIPRMAGKFMEIQSKYTLKLGKDIGGYIAMFDEYDESTAIAKAATSKAFTPKNQYFLTLDADGVDLSSDHYLRVTSKITRQWKIHRSSAKSIL